MIIGTDNYWYISADGSATGDAPGTGWVSLGVKATGEKGAQGDAIFAANGVDNTAPDFVKFTLANGDVITLLKSIGNAISRIEVMTGGTVDIQAGWEAEIRFRVNPSGATVLTDLAKWKLDQVGTTTPRVM